MRKIPMLDLYTEYKYMKNNIDAAIKQCLEQQKWILGPEVKELEDNIAKYIGVKHTIGVSSGTEALVLSLRALAIKIKGKEYWERDDIIITTPFTFTATGDAILRSGATPVFIDIDPVDCNINPKKIRDYIKSESVNRKSKIVGILPVHLYGQSCEMDEIMAIAGEHNLFVVEDVAQAFGGMWNGKKLGSIGNAGTFSFFPSKNLGGFGDGGMIATNDDQTSELISMLLKHGGRDKYNVDHIGYNARLDTIQAAILLVKLKYINEFNERRKQIAEKYTKGLAGLTGLSLTIPEDIFDKKDSYHAFHQYTICTSRRDELQVYLKERGVSTMVYYPIPLHKMKVFEGKMKIFEDLKNSENASKEVISLPMEPLQKDIDIAYVIKSIRGFFEN